MISFENDYSEGCLPEVLKALGETNYIQEPGYGTDIFCASAAKKIKEACGCPEGKVYFVNGGTQANQLVIDTTLQAYDGVVSAVTGHVNVHEAGAIEFTGHKVLPLPAHDGKIDSKELEDFLDTFFSDGNREQMVQPGMVYISHPTEYGTLYTKKELKDISSICKKYNIPLFADGARLGYGLMARNTDVDLKVLSECCDVFYIGGTKVGALCGEALVYPTGKVPAHFSAQIKQHGALSAKGRLFGVQFDTLFTDDLYMKAGKHAIDLAERLKEIFKELNMQFFLDSPTNQQFVVMENGAYEKLKEKVRVSFWEKYDDNHTVLRFATSWATKPENVEALRDILKEVVK